MSSYQPSAAVPLAARVSAGRATSGHEQTPDREILRARIRFALRRATGTLFDIDAMLRRPELRQRRIATWRAVATAELHGLLDQLEHEFRTDDPALFIAEPTSDFMDSGSGGHVSRPFEVRS